MSEESKVTQYIGKLHSQIKEDMAKDYVFRGQRNSAWGLKSSAYRRYAEQTPTREEFIKYNCRLVDDAKNANYHIKGDKKLQEIEMLAELRHYNAATALFDFTGDFLVALWFACASKTEKDTDGKIFIVNIKDIEKFLQLNSNDKKKFLNAILRFNTRNDDTAQTTGEIAQKEKPILWYWKPSFEVNNRLSAQKGVFIFGLPVIKKKDIDYKEIVIKKEDKEDIRKELKSYFGISENSLFNDLPGFAEVNDEHHKIFAKEAIDYFRAGNNYSQQGKWDYAIEQYDEVIELEPNVANTYYNRGIAKANLGKNEEAIADYSEAIKLNPDYAMTYNNRGVAKVNLGKIEEAIKDYSEAIKLNPHASTYNNRGVAKADLGKNEEAIADYSEAIKLNPDYAMAYNNRGNTKANLGKNEEAIADYSQAIELNPDNAMAYNNRGIAKHNLGKNEEAIADYSKAIELNPDDAEAYDNRGVAKHNFGKNEEAIADYSKAIELKPDHANAYYNRGTAKVNLGKNEEAIADYSKAIELKSDYAKAYYNRGIAKRALNDIHGAKADFAEAKRLDPTLPDPPT